LYNIDENSTFSVHLLRVIGNRLHKNRAEGPISPTDLFFLGS